MTVVQGKRLIIIGMIMVFFMPVISIAGPTGVGCCPTDTAPRGHLCPASAPCDPVGDGYCISCWEQAIKQSETVSTPIQTDPGGWLYGPSQGVRSFSTFNGNTQFDASAYGNDSRLYLVGGFAVCFLGATPTGIIINVLNAVGPDYNTFDGGSIYIASGIGKKGFADCAPWARDWDAFPNGDCSYYAWNFNPASKSVFADMNLANRMANASNLPLYQAMENFTCVNPYICDVSSQTVHLNFPYIMSQISSGMMDIIMNRAPQYQVTTYSNASLPPECTAFSLVSLEDEGGTSPVVKCWDGKGKFINCEGISGLTNRSSRMSILSTAESYSVSAGERGSFFYDDPTTGLRIRSPYGMISEQGEARAEFGTSNNCRVSNFWAFGSRETGWINRINGTGPESVCEQNDWDCIYHRVRQVCANYESNPNCRLVEEFIDGIPSIQFGNQTNLIGERNGTCWSSHYYPLEPDDPALLPPDGFDDLAMVESPAAQGIYLTCGDFQVIERRYICSGDRLIDNDPSKNASIHAENLNAAVQSGAIDVTVDWSTGDIISYTYGGVASTPADSSGNPVSLGASAESDCPVDEMICIVSWSADTQIYSDGQTRGDISPTDPYGAPQTAPMQPMVEKQVRSCKTSNTGMPVCPYDPTTEAVETDCGCVSMMGEAIANLSVLRTAANDIKCGDA